MEKQLVINFKKMVEYLLKIKDSKKRCLKFIDGIYKNSNSFYLDYTDMVEPFKILLDEIRIIDKFNITLFYSLLDIILKLPFANNSFKSNIRARNIDSDYINKVIEIYNIVLNSKNEKLKDVAMICYFLKMHYYFHCRTIPEELKRKINDIAVNLIKKYFLINENMNNLINIFNSLILYEEDIVNVYYSDAVFVLFNKLNDDEINTVVNNMLVFAEKLKQTNKDLTKCTNYTASSEYFSLKELDNFFLNKLKTETIDKIRIFVNKYKNDIKLSILFKYHSIILFFSYIVFRKGYKNSIIQELVLKFFKRSFRNMKNISNEIISYVFNNIDYKIPFLKCNILYTSQEHENLLYSFKDKLLDHILSVDFKIYDEFVSDLEFLLENEIINEDDFIKIIENKMYSNLDLFFENVDFFADLIKNRKFISFFRSIIKNILFNKKVLEDEDYYSDMKDFIKKVSSNRFYDKTFFSLHIIKIILEYLPNDSKQSNLLLTELCHMLFSEINYSDLTFPEYKNNLISYFQEINEIKREEVTIVYTIFLNRMDENLQKIKKEILNLCNNFTKENNFNGYFKKEKEEENDILTYKFICFLNGTIERFIYNFSLIEENGDFIKMNIDAIEKNYKEILFNLITKYDTIYELTLFASHIKYLNDCYLLEEFVNTLKNKIAKNIFVFLVNCIRLDEEIYETNDILSNQKLVDFCSYGYYFIGQPFYDFIYEKIKEEENVKQFIKKMKIKCLAKDIPDELELFIFQK